MFSKTSKVFIKVLLLSLLTPIVPSMVLSRSIFESNTNEVIASNNNIDMKKLKRDGKFGSVPTIYKIPTANQIKTILDGMKNNNNSLLGREILKKKKAKILEIFDKAADQEESRTSIAEKVAKNLGVNCNRKLVRSVLDAKRSSKLEKLKKIS